MCFKNTTSIFTPYVSFQSTNLIYKIFEISQSESGTITECSASNKTERKNDAIKQILIKRAIAPNNLLSVTIGHLQLDNKKLSNLLK